MTNIVRQQLPFHVITPEVESLFIKVTQAAYVSVAREKKMSFSDSDWIPSVEDMWKLPSGNIVDTFHKAIEGQVNNEQQFHDDDIELAESVAQAMCTVPVEHFLQDIVLVLDRTRYSYTVFSTNSESPYGYVNLPQKEVW